MRQTLEAKAFAVVQCAGLHCVLTDSFGAVATLLSGGTVSVDDLADSGDLPTDGGERAHGGEASHGLTEELGMSRGCDATS